MKHQYKNLQISSVDYGFGWIYKDDPSTKTIDEVLENLDREMEKLIKNNKTLIDAMGENRMW